MKQILNRLFDQDQLSRAEAFEVLTDIAAERYNASQVAAFISVYLMRPVSVDELGGFRDALLKLCVPFEKQGLQSIDLCGTGGDGKNTFNISTLSSFVVAGAGYKVTKHGNYGVSSVCGSSNVLEQLGYSFSNDQDRLLRELDQAGICFLHAPLFHPAMKSVAPIRRDLGVKTFFNMLGPLVNPAQPTHQLTGVFNLKLLRLYRHLLDEADRHYTVVHALDGYDEISLTGPAKVASNDGEHTLYPQELGYETLRPEELFGGETVQDAAKLFVQIISGEGTGAQNAAVLANSALAIKTFEPAKSLTDCHNLAHEALLSGKAQNTLTTLLTTNAA